MPKVIVVGAGLGGLAAAIRLAAQGHTVHIFEAASSAGGKAGEVTIDGVSVDTGPSVLTMPEVLSELLAIGGWRLDEQLELLEPEPAFRYLYPNGACLDMFPKLEQSIDSVQSVLGSDAKAEFVAFLKYAKTIWDLSTPQFIFGPAPTWTKMIQMGVQKLGVIHKVDPLRSMQKAISKQIKNKELQWLFWRYATYNGSDVRVAPATLNCIAHVELALGGYGIKGGIRALIDCLVRLAKHLGVQMHFDSPVQQLLINGRQVCGVRVGARSHQCDVVVANADAAHVSKDLLPIEQSRFVRPPEPVSMSGWTGIFKGHHSSGIKRVAHTVLFPEDYESEFRDIFDENKPPQEPTVYLCAQTQCHQREGWRDAEAVFTMINCPPEPINGTSKVDTWDSVKETVIGRLRQSGLMGATDPLLWTRTPTELAQQFPGSRGAIYGASSNTKSAAFTRPANRINKLPGLYLASGSAHPGGGMPLAMLSGKAASEAVIHDYSA